MAYEEHASLPSYETAKNADGTWAQPRPGAFLWAKEGEAPPPIGAPILALINACGPAVVTGYFTQDGYLGVLCDLIAPPAWHVRQNKGNPRGHLFGPELERASTPHDVSTPFGRACFARDWLETRERKAAGALAGVAGVGTGAMGLTPDDVKQSRDYQRAKTGHAAAFERLQDFNATFTKTFKRELAATRATKRTPA